MYSKGEGVPKDDEEAARWYRKAADQGHADAQAKLGLMYYTGVGVIPRGKDYREAIHWFRKAADQGHADAQFSIGVICDERDGAKEYELTWFEWLYAKSAGASGPDYARGLDWYRKAANQGHAKAQCNLGLSFNNGRGVKRDDAKAVHWYRKAADQGLPAAQTCLGVMYDSGLGVAKDEAEAARWYRKAADQGDARAQYNLARLFKNGLGVAKDEAEAARWYRKAADQGSARAQYNLGMLYKEGLGVPKDDVEAYAWISIYLDIYIGTDSWNEEAAPILTSLTELMTPDQLALAKARSIDLRREIQAKRAGK
jgi:TPR repeat protein